MPVDNVGLRQNKVDDRTASCKLGGLKLAVAETPIPGQSVQRDVLQPIGASKGIRWVTPARYVQSRSSE
eukprot:6169807-Pleurochrysis_carterae.AAC.2